MRFENISVPRLLGEFGYNQRIPNRAGIPAEAGIQFNQKLTDSAFNL